MEELELKNKSLNDRLNGQIYQQASKYKEKTMNALMNSKHGERGSYSPLRSSSNGAAAPISYGLAGNNESAFARSPLGGKRIANAPPRYHVQKSTERANIVDDDPGKSYSPMRRKSRSP